MVLTVRPRARSRPRTQVRAGQSLERGDAVPASMVEQMNEVIREWEAAERLAFETLAASQRRTLEEENAALRAALRISSTHRSISENL